MGDDEQEELERVKEWIGRLEVFALALDDIDGDSATEFANNTIEAMQARGDAAHSPGSDPRNAAGTGSCKRGDSGDDNRDHGLGGHA
jgi:hypothetical protein